MCRWSHPCSDSHLLVKTRVKYPHGCGCQRVMVDDSRRCSGWCSGRCSRQALLLSLSPPPPPVLRHLPPVVVVITTSVLSPPGGVLSPPAHTRITLGCSWVHRWTRNVLWCISWGVERLSGNWKVAGSIPGTFKCQGVSEPDAKTQLLRTSSLLPCMFDTVMGVGMGELCTDCKAHWIKLLYKQSIQRLHCNSKENNNEGMGNRK